MNSSQLSMSRSPLEFFTPMPMTRLPFSRSFPTNGEKSLSPEMMTKTSTCCFCAEVEGVDDEPDIGRVLARVGHVGDLDQFEAASCRGRHVALYQVQSRRLSMMILPLLSRALSTRLMSNSLTAHRENQRRSRNRRKGRGVARNDYDLPWLSDTEADRLCNVHGLRVENGRLRLRDLPIIRVRSNARPST